LRLVLGFTVERDTTARGTTGAAATLSRILPPKEKEGMLLERCGEPSVAPATCVDAMLLVRTSSNAVEGFEDHAESPGVLARCPLGVFGRSPSRAPSLEGGGWLGVS
jgi:hypothetical protein